MNHNQDERENKLNDQTSGISEDTTTNEDQSSSKSQSNRDEESLM